MGVPKNPPGWIRTQKNPVGFFGYISGCPNPGQARDCAAVREI